MTVAGADHVITLTGTCASLDVSGNNNTVSATLAPGAPLVVAGSEHRVRWRSTGEPRTDISGDAQDVARVR